MIMTRMTIIRTVKIRVIMMEIVMIWIEMMRIIISLSLFLTFYHYAYNYKIVIMIMIFITLIIIRIQTEQIWWKNNKMEKYRNEVIKKNRMISMKIRSFQSTLKLFLFLIQNNLKPSKSST